MDPRQKEFSPSAPLVWVDVKINAFAGSVLRPWEIHQPRVSHVIRSVCVQVDRELTYLDLPASAGPTLRIGLGLILMGLLFSLASRRTVEGTVQRV